jgi:hypothetical protein
MDKMLNKHVEIDDTVRAGAVTKFWEKHNGTYVGSVYYKTVRGIFKRMKTTFMDINSNYRPIFYIENDEASYPKIFKYIELKETPIDPANTYTNEWEMKPLEEEIQQWIKKYKSYPNEMDQFVSQMSVNTTYIKKLKELKKDKSLVYPFNIQLDLYIDDGLKNYKRFISNENELDDLIRYLRSKQKSIKGTSFFRIGKMDERDLEQALLAQRLKSLEIELYSHIAATPASEALFKDLLEVLIQVNRESKLMPTSQFLSKLEYKEMKAEYQDLFKNAQLDEQKLSAFSKKVIENLSPRYQKKLGITDAKNWVATMKAGRAGILITGLGTGGLGGGTILLRLWNWYNYDKDSEFNIINAKDEDEFKTNLNKYLKSKFPVNMIVRLYAKSETEMSLKDLHAGDKDEKELLKIVNEIITQRKQFKTEEKLLTDLEDQFSKVIDGIQEKSGGEPNDQSSDTNGQDSTNTDTQTDPKTDPKAGPKTDPKTDPKKDTKTNPKVDCKKTPKDKECVLPKK